MNRNQRRLGRLHQKREIKHLERFERACGTETELEEVFPVKSKRKTVVADKFTTNKCCYVAPTHVDFGQITEDLPIEKYPNVLEQQYGVNPLLPETINKLDELRRVLCKITPKNNGLQRPSDKHQSAVEFVDAADPTTVTQWQNIENAEDIDKFIGHGKERSESCLHLPDNVHICETPRIKIIAKKFSRLKANSIELRKLDEKVVCVEYDVFVGDTNTPREKLRAFFSIKPTYGDGPSKDTSNKVPSNINNKFKIIGDDLKQFNEKEIEIIDGAIQQNKTYLEDLKRILRRKQAACERKNKNCLDLMTLYKMAKRRMPALDDEFSNTNFLSKVELQEMKSLILKKCASSVHGINRRTLKKEPDQSFKHMGVISQSIVAELWRDSGASN